MKIYYVSEIQNRYLNNFSLNIRSDLNILIMWRVFDYVSIVARGVQVYLNYDYNLASVRVRVFDSDIRLSLSFVI